MDFIYCIHSLISNFQHIDFAILFSGNIDTKKNLKENTDLIIDSVTWSKKLLIEVSSYSPFNRPKCIVTNKKLGKGFIELLNIVGYVQIDEEFAFVDPNFGKENVELSVSIVTDLDNLMKLVELCLKESVEIVKAYRIFEKRNSCVICESKVETYCEECRKNYCNSCLTDYHNFVSKKEHLEKHLSNELTPDVLKFNFLKNLLDDFILILQQNIANELKLNENECSVVESLIACTDCGTINETDVQFCMMCFKYLEKTEKTENQGKFICLQCKAENKNDLNFCSQCGFKFRDADFSNLENESENFETALSSIALETVELPQNPIVGEQEKTCPICTVICDKWLNFCPVCDHLFNDVEQPNDLNLMEENIILVEDVEKYDENSNDLTVRGTCSFDMTHADVNNNASSENLKNTEKISSMLERLNEYKTQDLMKPYARKDIEGVFSEFIQKIKNMDNPSVPRTARCLMSFISTILKALNKEHDIASFITDKYENFLSAYLQNKDVELDFEDCVEAIKNSGTFQSSQRFLKNTCEICFEKKSMNKILNLSCQCNICTGCFKAGYKVAINSSESLISINEFSCLACKEPKFDPKNKNEFQSHLEFLTMLFSYHLEQKEKDRFQKTLTEICINDMSNFVWCQHGCNSGYFIENVAHFNAFLKVYCKLCKKYTCFKCKERWEPAHENRTCEEYKKFKATNGVVEYLANNSIVCPNCNATYKLDAGACLHYTCTKCKYAFCGSCKCKMSKELMNDCVDSCKDLGLHGHHPYNCFTLVRDFSVNELVEFLNINRKSLSLNLGTSFTICQFKIADSSGNDVLCGEPCVPCGIKNEKTEYCEKHLKQHLYYIIADEKLDPLSLYDNAGLKQIIQRAKLTQPPITNTGNQDVRGTYIQFINRYIPKQNLSGFRF